MLQRMGKQRNSTIVMFALEVIFWKSGGSSGGATTKMEF
jgi:hypothetical protein